MIKWSLDPAHSEISFKVKHLMITNVKGILKSCKLDVSTDNEEFTPAKIDFSGEVNSIDTHDEKRDAHLRSADFFDAEKYPFIKFTGTSFTKKQDSMYDLEGDLIIKGITHKIRLEVEFEGLVKDPWGNTKAGFSVNGRIKRKDWGLNWNAALEAGGVMVSDEVKISCDIQLIKQA